MRDKNHYRACLRARGLFRGMKNNLPRVGDHVAYVTGLSFEGIPIKREGIVTVAAAGALDLYFGIIDLKVGELDALRVAFDPTGNGPHSWSRASDTIMRIPVKDRRKNGSNHAGRPYKPRRKTPVAS